MLIEPLAASATVNRRRDPFTSLLRYAAAWALVVVAPLVALSITGYEEPLADPTIIATTLAGSAALFTGMYLAGRVLDLPGTRGTVHGAPIMVACFVIAALILFAFRRQPFFIVPFGKAQAMEELSSFPIRRLKRPDIPADRAANIVADFHADLPPEWERLLARASLAGVPVYHYKQLTESITGQVKIESLSENSFGSLMPSRSYTPVKRLIDIIGSLILLAALAPLMLVVALIIWREDGDTPFFIQTRTGLGGRPFRMYKFRSMTNRVLTSYEEARSDAVTQADDARITRFGHFIRKFRIDELPQLLNVLKGEMSLIGPRPEANALADLYEESLAFYSYRNILRPGLTGWAQVNQGHVASIEDIDMKLQYDFYYIKYFSFWLDVLIVMRTIHTILTGFGSK